MDDENEVETEVNSESEENFGTGLHVMYISYDEEVGYPEMDLGDISPYLAISMLQSIIDALEVLVPSPKVIFRGKTIMEPYECLEDEEEIGDD